MVCWLYSVIQGVCIGPSVSVWPCGHPSHGDIKYVGRGRVYASRSLFQVLICFSLNWFEHYERMCVCVVYNNCVFNVYSILWCIGYFTGFYNISYLPTHTHMPHDHPNPTTPLYAPLFHIHFLSHDPITSYTYYCTNNIHLPSECTLHPAAPQHSLSVDTHHMHTYTLVPRITKQVLKRHICAWHFM